MNKYKEALERIKINYCVCCESFIDTSKDIECDCPFQNDINELQELVDKEKALTLNYISDGYADGYPVYDTAECPNCGRLFEVYDEEHYKYCPDCGQRLKENNKNEN